MAEVEQRCLEAFPRWLARLADDVRAVLALVGRTDLPSGARRHLAGGLNYLLKSIDLIPDGIEDLGFLDDAFVLRLSAKRALVQLGAEEPPEPLARLAADTELIEAFLGPTYAALDAYVTALENVSVRGRSPAGLLDQESALDEFASEVRTWADGYTTPDVPADDKYLIKLKSFLATKLAK